MLWEQQKMPADTWYDRLWPLMYAHAERKGDKPHSHIVSDVYEEIYFQGMRVLQYMDRMLPSHIPHPRIIRGEEDLKRQVYNAKVAQKALNAFRSPTLAEIMFAIEHFKGNPKYENEMKTLHCRLTVHLHTLEFIASAPEDNVA